MSAATAEPLDAVARVIADHDAYTTAAGAPACCDDWAHDFHRWEPAAEQAHALHVAERLAAAGLLNDRTQD